MRIFKLKQRIFDKSRLFRWVFRWTVEFIFLPSQSGHRTVDSRIGYYSYVHRRSIHSSRRSRYLLFYFCCSGGDRSDTQLRVGDSIPYRRADRDYSVVNTKSQHQEPEILDCRELPIKINYYFSYTNSILMPTNYINSQTVGIAPGSTGVSHGAGARSLMSSGSSNLIPTHRYRWTSSRMPVATRYRTCGYATVVEITIDRYRSISSPSEQPAELI
jgi:hypothetical protein